MKKFFSIIILLTGIVNLGLAASISHTSHSKNTQHLSKKKLISKHKKNHHKKTSGKHTKKTKKNRIVKPHVVNREAVSSAESTLKPTTTPLATSTSSNVTTTTPVPTHGSFYRILTQPMSAPSPTLVHETRSEFPQVEQRYGFAASIEHRLVDFVHKTVSSLRYSAYKLGGSHIDTSQGIYVVDCSGYVDHTLRVVYPNAYLSLVGSSGVDKPNTSHYYNFFTNLTDDPSQFWSRVEDIEQLRPGDILVFRYKNIHGHVTGGHVMVVMNKPERDGNAYIVSVADSAASGHSDDTRQNHVSGIGIGTILLKVDPKTRQPSAYAWTLDSPWRNNVNFAMARPLEVRAVNSWS